MKLRSLAILVTFALSACGGGSSSPISPGQSSGGSNPKPAASANPRGSTNPSTWLNKATVTISFPVKSGTTSQKAKSQNVGPQYVSPSSGGFETVVNSVSPGGIPSWVPTVSFAPLTGPGSDCTESGGTETCTVVIPAPVGTVNYTFNDYSTPTGGYLLNTYTGDETIVQGTNNPLNVVMQGVPYSLTVGLPSAPIVANTVLSGSAQDIALTVEDAEGNPIVGPADYAAPVTLSEDSPLSTISLTLNGLAGFNSSLTINSPADASAITLDYNGVASNNFTLTATSLYAPLASTVVDSTVQNIAFPTGTLDDTAANGGLNTDPNWNAQTVFFYQTSGTQAVTASELGYTNAPYNLGFAVALDISCAGIATVSGVVSNGFTVTASGNPGVCFGNVTESGSGYPLTNHAADVFGNETTDGKFYVSVTTASIGVNGKHRH